jgi:PAS domain-containing protein
VSFTWTPYAIPSLVAALLMLGLVARAWRYRETELGGPFVRLILCATLWIISDAFLVLGREPATMDFFFKLAHVGILALAPCLLVLALRANDRSHLATPERVAIYCVPPALALALLGSNDIHHWMYAPLTLDPSVPYPYPVFELGTPYLAALAYTLLLVLFSIGLTTTKYIRDWKLFRLDALLLIPAIAMPVGAVVLEVAKLNPLPHLRLAPFALAVMTFLFARGLQRTGVLDVVRVGRGSVIDGMSDGVVVVDMRDRLADINAAACSILSLGPLRAAAQPLRQVFAHHPDLIELFRGATEGRSELRVAGAGEEIAIYDLQIFSIGADEREVSSRALVLHDISERVRAQEERNRETTYVQLLQRVALAGNEAANIEEILRHSLERICETVGWEIGQVLVPDPEDGSRLVSGGIWHLKYPEHLMPYVRAAEEIAYELGSGAPGHALATRRVTWIEDEIADRDPRRVALAAEVGARSSLALPVTGRRRRACRPVPALHRTL